MRAPDRAQARRRAAGMKKERRKKEVKQETLDTRHEGHSTCLGRGARICPKVPSQCLHPSLYQKSGSCHALISRLAKLLSSALIFRRCFSSRSPACPGCRRPTVRTPSPPWRPKHPGRLDRGGVVAESYLKESTAPIRLSVRKDKHADGGSPEAVDKSISNIARGLVHVGKVESLARSVVPTECQAEPSSKCLQRISLAASRSTSSFNS